MWTESLINTFLYLDANMKNVNNFWNNNAIPEKKLRYLSARRTKVSFSIFWNFDVFGHFWAKNEKMAKKGLKVKITKNLKLTFVGIAIRNVHAEFQVDRIKNKTFMQIRDNLPKVHFWNFSWKTLITFEKIMLFRRNFKLRNLRACSYQISGQQPTKKENRGCVKVRQNSGLGDSWFQMSCLPKILKFCNFYHSHLKFGMNIR